LRGQVIRDRAADRRNDTLSHGLTDAKWIADCQHQIAYLQLVGVAELQIGQCFTARIDAQHSEVYRGGPADRAGLRTGDVVLAIDGREVNDPQALRFRIATRKLGETAALDVLRRGQRITVGIALQDAPETPPRDLMQLTGNQPLAGATVANLSPAFAEELGIDTLEHGVIVTEIAPGSPANRLRVRPGDIVVKLNDRDVKDVRGLQTQLRDANQWTVVLRRNGQLLSFSVRS
jgi:S1-C subfamily serine protease